MYTYPKHLYLQGYVASDTQQAYSRKQIMELTNKSHANERCITRPSGPGENALLHKPWRREALTHCKTHKVGY